MTDFEIELLLQQTIGLKVTSIGKATLERSVKRRMHALSLTDKKAYFEKLNSSNNELKTLIEEVVIPETWFFRDREPFKAMTSFLFNRWEPNHRNNIFRVLSAPCSTGEEPYSMAMALFNSGWPADRFAISGADISQRAIDKARKGIYTEHSFRGSDHSYRPFFFTMKNDTYVLKESIREKVHFQNGNILDRAFMKRLGLFDVIFFRNVLIYFDSLSRHNAITTLYKMLADDGILFVGHAETTLFNNSHFRPAPYPQAFAFHKKNMLEQINKTPVSGTEKNGFKSEKTSLAREITHLQNKGTLPESDLNAARVLADKGKLQEATGICETYIDKHGPSALAFFLLGIISDARNDLDQAEKFFRKALYLDPNHEETLIFLSLLTERRGAINEAKNLKQRITRLQKNKTANYSNT